MEKLDRSRILSKLDEMIQYVKELRDMLPEEEEYQHNLIKRRASEKTIEVAIESLIDVSAMIVSSQKLGLPANEENIFDILIENGILSKKLGEILKDMKGFRNILIHRCAHIDDVIVHHNLNNFLDDFYEFKDAIESYMSIQKS